MLNRPFRPATINTAPPVSNMGYPAFSRSPKSVSSAQYRSSGWAPTTPSSAVRTPSLVSAARDPRGATMGGPSSPRKGVQAYPVPSNANFGSNNVVRGGSYVPLPDKTGYVQPTRQASYVPLPVSGGSGPSTEPRAQSQAPFTRPTVEPRAQAQAQAASKGIVIRSSGPESARHLANSAVRESSRVAPPTRSMPTAMPSVPATARAMLRRSSKDLRLGRPSKEMTEVPEVLKTLRKSWCAFRIQRRWRIYCTKKIKQVLVALGESPEIQFVGTREWLQKSGKPLGMSVSAPADQQQWEKSKKGAKRELDHRFLYDFRVAKEKKQPIQVRAAANIPQPMRTVPGMQPYNARMPGFPAGVGMQRMSIRR